MRAKEEVGAFLDRLVELLPHTPIRIMVGLADGADMLVAETALERKLLVEAVLPMPLEEYAKDFNAEALARLHRLLERPDVQKVVLTLPDRGANPLVTPNRRRIGMRCMRI